MSDLGSVAKLRYPLSIPYLVDTYFPNTKRSQMYRPYSEELDNPQHPSKRPRLGRSPVEHNAVAAQRKHERNMEKSLSAGQSCQRNIPNMNNVPLNVLKYLQTQGATLNRTNEAMELLTFRLSELTKAMECKLSTPPCTRPVPHHPASTLRLLASYHTIISEALEKFKTYRDSEESTNVLNYAPATEKYATIQTALDCISKIRDLMYIQCNVDLYNSGTQIPTNTSHPITTSIYPISNVSVSNTRRKPTWEKAYSSLNAMEQNLRMYINAVGEETPSSSGCHADWMLTPQSCPNRPMLTDRKRKFVGFADSTDSAAPPHRKKLNPKKLSFSFPSDTRMEVDD